jgi:hypothetical protein
VKNSAAGWTSASWRRVRVLLPALLVLWCVWHLRSQDRHFRFRTALTRLGRLPLRSSAIPESAPRVLRSDGAICGIWFVAALDFDLLFSAILFANSPLEILKTALLQRFLPVGESPLRPPQPPASVRRKARKEGDFPFLPKLYIGSILIFRKQRCHREL